MLLQTFYIQQIRRNPEFDPEKQAGINFFSNTPLAQYNIRSEGPLCIGMYNALNQIYQTNLGVTEMFSDTHEAAKEQRDTHSNHDRSGVSTTGDEYTQIEYGRAKDSTSRQEGSTLNHIVVQLPKIDTVKYMDGWGRIINNEDQGIQTEGKQIMTRNSQISEEYFKAIKSGDDTEALKLLREQAGNHADFMNLDKELKGVNSVWENTRKEFEDSGFSFSYVGAPGGDTAIISGNIPYADLQREVIEIMGKKNIAEYKISPVKPEM